MDRKELDERIKFTIAQMHRAESDVETSSQYLASLRTALDNLITERQRLTQAEAKRKKPLFDK